MDDIVRQAMAKWPHVPACQGWLGLDARGNWYMRDDRVQAAGPFPDARGALLRHDKLIDFIQRNYEADAQGRWYFQNGPQRVFVELEAAPLVARLDATSVHDHTGRPLQVQDCLLDEAGRLYLACDRGLALVHTQDMHLAADRVERGEWVPREVQARELPARYGYVPSPARAANAEAAQG